MNHTKLKKTFSLSTLLKKLGPGIITGASDDDPSGIATYTQAGAQFGPKLLWTAVFTYPLMAGIQEMCARIGLISQHGLAGIIKQYFPKPVLWLVVLLSFISITLNIGADIAGMGAVAHLLVPSIPPYLFSIAFTLILMRAIIIWNYKKIASVLKYLCISLFAYLLIPFFIQTNWRAALWNTFVPTIENNSSYLMALVGILGTTISPYLFFWQTSMEAEERLHHPKIIIDIKILRAMKIDVRGGMALSNMVFYFIVLTSANVLFPAGIRDIQTVEQAAIALKPLAGKFTYLLFAGGIIGTGLLAIPVLAGSLSYMMAETFDWKEGLDKKFHEARGFYITMIVSLLLGLCINFMGWSPIKSLLYAAVLYGLTAPILILLILLICNKKTIMGDYTNRVQSNILGILGFLLMSVAALMLLIQLISFP